MKPLKAALRSMILMLPALALAMTAFAQTRDPTLNDPQQPGSVIVFSKFIKGTVVLPEGGTAPASALKIGVMCPNGVTCSSDQEVKIRFHWVCGTSEADLASSFVCRETDFDVTATVFEKIVLTPDGFFAGVSTESVPAAGCDRGYLIGWVITPTDDTPIKFDGLIGNADLREGGTAEAGYPAIPIQADPALPNGAAITTNSDGGLVFDGAAGHYQALTGRVFGDVRYANLTTPPTFTRAFLTLLTLDVRSNRPNAPVFVDLTFFGGNPSAIGNQQPLSTFTEFICWEEVAVDAINANLTTAVMGIEGVFASAPAENDTGLTTLLGLVESVEGPSLTMPARETIDTLSNDSVPVPTTFVPTRSPNFLP